MECDFGFEYVNHECRPIQSVDTSQCGAITSGQYHVSRSKHRLVSDDVCADVSRVISDTDGKGNLPGGPGAGHKHRGRAARAFVVILVSYPPPIFLTVNGSLHCLCECQQQSAWLLAWGDKSKIAELLRWGCCLEGDIWAVLSLHKFYQMSQTFSEPILCQHFIVYNLVFTSSADVEPELFPGTNTI